MSCKSIILKKIKQQLVELWKSSNTFEWKHAIFVFLSFPGCAETLVRWGRKIKYYLTAYILSNISAKNYKNRLMYVEVIANQSSVVFLRYSVYATKEIIQSSIMARYAMRPFDKILWPLVITITIISNIWKLT